MVGTILGRFLLRLAHLKSLLDIKTKNPESASFTANGIIASVLVENLTPDRGAFLDVGAHIGSVFSSVHHVSPSAKIFAVEADPMKAEWLKGKFPYCTLFDVALGEQSGEVEFYRNMNEAGYSSLIPVEGPGVEKVAVPIARLDDLLPTQVVDAIKMDIEGAELGALRGAEALFERSRPIVMFESMGLEENALGYSPTLLWEWFFERNYHVLLPDHVAHMAPQLSLDSFIDSHHYPFRTRDYFAVPAEKVDAVRERARSVLGINV